MISDFDWLFVADIFGALCLILGAVFILISSIGMIFYPDLLSRQHVATKPQVFSLIMFLLGVIVLVRETAVTWTLLIVIAFQLVSSPISAHMLSRAGYRTGRVLPQELLIDELGEDLRTGVEENLPDIIENSHVKSKINENLAVADVQSVRGTERKKIHGLDMFAQSEKFSQKPKDRK